MTVRQCPLGIQGDGGVHLRIEFHARYARFGVQESHSQRGVWLRRAQDTEVQFQLRSVAQPVWATPNLAKTGKARQASIQLVGCMGRSSHELANLGDIDVRSKPVADEAAGVPALQAVESVLESELDVGPSPFPTISNATCGGDLAGIAV